MLDAETAASHTITVLATSTDSSTSSQRYTITVTDIDDTILVDSDNTANRVPENAANGTVIGITALASSTEHNNDTVSYSLLDNAGGRFNIDSATGVVTVANGQLLDANIAVTHTITIQVSSSTGRIETRNFDIRVGGAEELSDSNAREGYQANLLNTPVFLDNVTTDRGSDDKETDDDKIIISNPGSTGHEAPDSRLTAKKPLLSEYSGFNAQVSNNEEEIVVERAKQGSENLTVSKTRSSSVQRTGLQMSEQDRLESELNDGLALFELTFGHDNENLWENIDLMRDQMDAERDLLEQQDVEIEFVAGATIGMTAGFVSWVLRGGALLSSLLSSVSLFKQFDPLAVVFKDSKKDGKARKNNQKNKPDHVEAMFDKHSKK